MLFRFIFACDAMRVSLGPIKVMQYCLQALWHPARKVREPIWKVKEFEKSLNVKQLLAILSKLVFYYAENVFSKLYIFPGFQ